MLLDGLRGVAAIAVAVVHMEKVFAGYTPVNAHLAVDFFLQLSGFIVAHAYAQRIAQGMSLRAFVWRRLSRLYPAFALGMLLAIGVAASTLILGVGGLSVQWTPRTLLCTGSTNLLMLPQPGCVDDSLLFPLNIPMWTVFYEVLINLLFFALVGSALMLRRTLWGAGAMLVLLLVVTHGATLDVGWRWETAGAGVVRLLFSFLVGLAIYNLRLRRRGVSALVASAVPIVLAAVLLNPVESYWLEVVAVVVVFPALVAVGALYEPPEGRLGWGLAQLGAASYVIYVLHKPAYQLAYGVLDVVMPGAVEAAGAWLGVAMLAGIVVVAWALARWYEPPMRRLMDSALKPPLRRGADQVAALARGRG